MSCLLTAMVSGKSRVPEPPARMMPLRARDCGLRISDFGLAGTGQNELFGAERVRGFQSAIRNPQSAIDSAADAQSLPGILLRGDVRRPIAVLQIPVDRLLDAGGERLARRPA